MSVYFLVKLRTSLFTSEDDQISGEPPLKTVSSKLSSAGFWPQVALPTSSRRGLVVPGRDAHGGGGEGLAVGAAVLHDSPGSL